MSDQPVEFQAKIYVYDLKNCAREFGFKADEGCDVSMVSGQPKADIEKKYFPTLSAKVLPEMLAEMLGSVRFKLSQGMEKPLDTAAIRQQHFLYLVAYSPAGCAANSNTHSISADAIFRSCTPNPFLRMEG